MVNKYQNTDRDIHARIYKFVVSCFRNVVKRIPKTVENMPIITQLSSSLTSMGANDQEADASSSRRDFIAKYHIVKKETKETHYWLIFIKDTCLVSKDTVEPYLLECQEILRIVSSIAENAKR